MSDKNPRKWGRYVSPVIVFFGSLLAVMLLEFLPWFAPLERAVFDYCFGIRGHLAPSPNVAVISIDESSLKELGPLPWSR